MNNAERSRSRHCEERSDEAIQCSFGNRLELLRYARNDGRDEERSTLIAPGFRPTWAPC
jgi:hypothetical protein